MNLPNLSFLGRRGNDWDFHALWPSLQRARHCMVTTRLNSGNPHAARVRISMTSGDGPPHVWLMVPRDSRLAQDIELDPSLTLSFTEPRSQQLVHLTGEVALVEAHHNPVYLHPSVRHAPDLTVVEGEQDFVMLRVDIPSDQRPRTQMDGVRPVDFSMSRPQQWSETTPSA
jgi:hypothetical protein